MLTISITTAFSFLYPLSSCAGAIRGLRPSLRPYQRRAVAWMLRRERPSPAHKTEDSEPAGDDGGAVAEAQPRWRRLATLDGQSELYFNPLTGGLATEAFEQAACDIRGGILCDEMGALGRLSFTFQYQVAYSVSSYLLATRWVHQLCCSAKSGTVVVPAIVVCRRNASAPSHPPAQLTRCFHRRCHRPRQDR